MNNLALNFPKLGRIVLPFEFRPFGEPVTAQAHR